LKINFSLNLEKAFFQHEFYNLQIHTKNLIKKFSCKTNEKNPVAFFLKIGEFSNNISFKKMMNSEKFWSLFFSVCENISLQFFFFEKVLEKILV